MGSPLSSNWIVGTLERGTRSDSVETTLCRPGRVEVGCRGGDEESMPVEEVGIAGVGYLPFLSAALIEEAVATRFAGRGRKDEDGSDCSKGGSREGAGRFVPAIGGATEPFERPECRTMVSKIFLQRGRE